MIKIKILTGSSRPGRFNPQVANWIFEILKKRENIAVHLLDLAEINLPFLDEPTPPSQGNYTKEHTKKWAASIGEADGFIFITPEYNHSTTAILKNAIDFLYKEWNFKPVSFISYGGPAGGSRAIEHLRGIVAEVKMYGLRETIIMPSYYENLNNKGEYQFSERQIKSANEILDDLIFWSTKMKEARIELAAK